MGRRRRSQSGQTAVNVIVEPMPLPTATVSVFVFEDDFPLNGEQDAGGGVDVLAPNEPGLGGFSITIYDNVGRFGDAAGQMTYDMFNMPLIERPGGNDRSGVTGMMPAPSRRTRTGTDGDPSANGHHGHDRRTCPKYEVGRHDAVPAGRPGGRCAICLPGCYGVVATPGADRIARGEEWLQTNTLDGG